MRIALPEQMLPTLIAWPKESKDRSGAFVAGGVRQLNVQDLALFVTNRRAFEEIYGTTDADEKELLFILQLADALAAKSLPRVKAALTRWIGPTEANKASHWPPDSKTPRKLIRFVEALIMRFNVRSGNAAPLVYWSDKERRMAFGLFCRDISTALFLLALEKVGVGSMGHCRGCGGVLIADRTNKQFCDGNCRSRHFMRLMRERQKSLKVNKKRRKR